MWSYAFIVCLLSVHICWGYILNPPRGVLTNGKGWRFDARLTSSSLRASPVLASRGAYSTTRSERVILRSQKKGSSDLERQPGGDRSWFTKIITALHITRLRMLQIVQKLQAKRRRSFTILGVIACLSLAMGGRARIGSTRPPPRQEVAISQLLDRVSRGGKGIDGVEVSRQGVISYEMDGTKSYTKPVALSEYMVTQFRKGNVPFRAASNSGDSSVSFLSLTPFIYLLLLFVMQKRMMTDGVGSAGQRPDSLKNLTFDDIAGIGPAKEEVKEIVSILKDPAPYLAAGARLPSGLLMVGKPGCGKTHLARIMASTAACPFYYCSGSDFVEMYVGRGAARLRKLFKKAAKQKGPCLIFIDEVDALGKSRNRAFGGGNDEADQTLNQLLASMDGLETSNNGVVVIAATNRFNVLDEALTRPGRFDRVVKVPMPDLEGRRDILEVHCRKLLVADKMNVLPKVAEMTAGMCGAELAAICNEAAIRAARRRQTVIRDKDFYDAVEMYISSRSKGNSAPLGNFLKDMLNQ